MCYGRYDGSSIVQIFNEQLPIWLFLFVDSVSRKKKTKIGWMSHLDFSEILHFDIRPKVCDGSYKCIAVLVVIQDGEMLGGEGKGRGPDLPCLITLE